MPKQASVVFVTGSSSGIGLALVRQLAALPDRYRVVASARSVEKLTAAGLSESEHLRFQAMELTEPDSRKAAIDAVAQRWSGVDILINNAGISYRSVVEHLSEDDVKLQFRTNLFGPLHLARLCLPHMRSQRSGRIINVSSVGGMMAMPTMGLYSSSKFALEGISEALYYEMKPWGVHVSLVQPGFVRSKSFKNVYISSAAKDAVEGSQTYANYYWNMGHFISHYMNNARATPEHIAAVILRTMQRKNPPLRIPASLDARFFTLMTRLVPRALYHRILYRKLPGIETWATGDHSALEAAEDLEEILPASSTISHNQ